MTIVLAGFAALFAIVYWRTAVRLALLAVLFVLIIEIGTLVDAITPTPSLPSPPASTTPPASGPLFHV